MMLVFQDLEGLTQVSDWMSAGICGPKLPLWADFLFLAKYSGPLLVNFCQFFPPSCGELGLLVNLVKLLSVLVKFSRF